MENLDERIRSATILVADQDPDILTLLRLHLKRLGFKNVTCASAGEHALEIIEAFSRKGVDFDLTIIDIILPGIDGYALCRKLRENSEAPAILLGAHFDENEREKIRELKNIEFLVKPFSLETAELVVEKVLTRHYLSRDLKASNAKNQQMLLNILQVIAKTMSVAHKAYEEQSRKVATLVRKIAKAMKFEPKEISLLGIAGVLHDIGMLSIEEAVLMKPGKLSDDEYELIKGHTVISSNILEPIEDLSAVLTTIRHHHENYDGTGYPDGLKREDIPLGARILCIADAYDAMTGIRPYRKEPLAHDEAMKRIAEGAGTQFDPEIVRILQEKIKFSV
ncbi:MAG: HD domain-containing phosphohydrolase [Planctomycetota bacterium]